MRPGTLGRALGIGARLAAQRILPQPAPPRTADEQRAASKARLRKAEMVGRQTRTVSQNVGRGSRNFGRALWNPFAHASSILWLEVTGMFFALFAVLFLQHLWTLRTSYRAGPEHTHFLVYAGFALLFLYFAGSSFVRARARSRRRAERSR